MVEILTEAQMALKAISRVDPVALAFSPCMHGMQLLEEFAAAHPVDYSYIEPRDFVDLATSAFAGIRSGTCLPATCRNVPDVVSCRHVRTLQAEIR